MAVLRWCQDTRIDWHYIAPESPCGTPLSKVPTVATGTSFLNEFFSSLAEARKKIIEWKEDYNHTRPHLSPGNFTPWEFAMKSRLETKAA